MDVVDLEEENRAEQMFEAVKNNDFDLLKKILSESDDAETLTSTIHQESGSTALMFASRVFFIFRNNKTKQWLHTCINVRTCFIVGRECRYCAAASRLWRKTVTG